MRKIISLKIKYYLFIIIFLAACSAQRPRIGYTSWEVLALNNRSANFNLDTSKTKLFVRFGRLKGRKSNGYRGSCKVLLHTINNDTVPHNIILPSCRYLFRYTNPEVIHIGFRNSYILTLIKSEITNQVIHGMNIRGTYQIKNDTFLIKEVDSSYMLLKRNSKGWKF
jgi:hypothetical protein